MDLIMTIKKVLETVIAASGFEGGEGILSEKWSTWMNSKLCDRNI